MNLDYFDTSKCGMGSWTWKVYTMEIIINHIAKQLISVVNPRNIQMV